MPRRPREECESQIYHVVQRGVGQQMIFEDDDDRRFFLELLRKHLCDGSPSSLLAWCLTPSQYIQCIFMIIVNSTSEWHSHR